MNEKSKLTWIRLATIPVTLYAIVTGILALPLVLALNQRGRLIKQYLQDLTDMYRLIVYGDMEHGWQKRKAKRLAKLERTDPLQNCPKCDELHVRSNADGAQLCQNFQCSVFQYREWSD